jgi:hypothetical protein
MNAKRYQVLIQDPKTRHEYVLPEVSHVSRTANSAYDWTNVLLNVLKDRTKCNLIGFYLYDRGSSWNNVVFQGRKYSRNEEQNARKIWREDGYTPIHNSGYDEYYLVSAKAMELDQGEFTVDDKGKKVTVSKITNAFLKHMDKKSTNRILLSNFIKRIT